MVQSMSVLRLTLTDLLRVFEEWKEQNPEAFQLDGSKGKRTNGGAFCYIEHLGRSYKLRKDTNVHGINRFLRVAKEFGVNGTLVAVRDSTRWSLLIKGSGGKSNGWFCEEDHRAKKKTHKAVA